ncbi:MAG: YkgJ family cysteine cluster protein [Dehalococcoidales bacterium]|nr:YkgJ family cysteine cluster protein [Dehalococcoidales bacterium]
MKDDTVKAETMECRRCGVCCTRHQAFVSPEDIARITAYLGITMQDWDRLYDDSRWQYSEYRLIRHVNGACAFLAYEDGLATCTIQEVKPACCAAWEPGPDRAECREGREKVEARK